MAKYIYKILYIPNGEYIAIRKQFFSIPVSEWKSKTAAYLALIDIINQYNDDLHYLEQFQNEKPNTINNGYELTILEFQIIRQKI